MLSPDIFDRHHHPHRQKNTKQKKAKRSKAAAPSAPPRCSPRWAIRAQPWKTASPPVRQERAGQNKNKTPALSKQGRPSAETKTSTRSNERVPQCDKAQGFRGGKARLKPRAAMERNGGPPTNSNTSYEHLVMLYVSRFPAIAGRVFMSILELRLEFPRDCKESFHFNIRVAPRLASRL